MAREGIAMSRSRALGFLVVLLGLAGASLLAQAAGRAAPLSQPYSSLFPQQRFGVEVVLHRGPIDYYDVSQIHAGWYQDVTFRSSPSRPNGMEYVQTIELSGGTMPNTSSLALAAERNPGSLWLIGNEPDCCYGQDCVEPTRYAQLYHDLYHFIKGRDSTALVANGGIVQPTPLRLQWLDMVWNAYQSLYGERMPVDVWNIHNMILQEKAGEWGCGIPPGITATQGVLYPWQENDNIVTFTQHILAFRQWMKDRGEQNKPLIISEYGVLMSPFHGFDEPRVLAFMRNTFDYLTTATSQQLGYPADSFRLVQRWAWYSLNDCVWGTLGCGFSGFNGNLFNPDTRQITAFGRFYGSYVFPESLYLPMIGKGLSTP